MPTHITINGRSYPSIDQMPPDVRRQYETALQLLSGDPGASADPSAGDVTVSTTAGDPATTTGPAFTTFTKLTSRRIVVNGQEYARWEDVPPAARAAFQSAGVGPQPPSARAAKRPVATARTVADPYLLADKPPATISLRLATLTVLLLAALLLGVAIGHFLH